MTVPSSTTSSCLCSDITAASVSSSYRFMRRHRRARVAHRKWSTLVCDGRPKQSQHLGAVLRRNDSHPGNRKHVRDVVQTHVRLAIFANEPCAIHAEDDRQVLDRDIVHDVI